MEVEIKKSEIEKHRNIWGEIAKKNNWYKEPFYIQVWYNNDGTINDSVSVINLEKDYILSMNRGNTYKIIE